MSAFEIRHHLVAFLKKSWSYIYFNPWVVGLISLVWFAIRTGTKPSRVVYSCQQVAAANTYTWLALCILPLFTGIRKSTDKLLAKRNIAFITLAVLVIIAFGVLGNVINIDYTKLEPVDQSAKFLLSGNLAQHEPASDIFVLSGISGNDRGVGELRPYGRPRSAFL